MSNAGQQRHIGPCHVRVMPKHSLHSTVLAYGQISMSFGSVFLVMII